jgi:hypothetical protein
LQSVTRFRAKIGEANAASQALFKRLGYVEVGRSEVFKEVTLELGCGGEGGEAVGADGAWERVLQGAAAGHKGRYDP